MSYMNRMWAAAGVAAVNSLSDQGQKLKSGFKAPLNYTGKRRYSSSSGGGDAADLRPLSAAVSSEIEGIVGGGRERSEESLRQVMYLNCWGQG